MTALCSDQSRVALTRGHVTGRVPGDMIAGTLGRKVLPVGGMGKLVCPCPS